MKSNKNTIGCGFIKGITDKKHLSNSLIPEIAIAGRSNVGKSSLINLLLKTKKIAKVSSKPGCTRQINFYSFNNSLHLVDLPGYGYSLASKNTICQYLDLIAYYLVGRTNLRKVILLIDARRLLKEIDLDFIMWLESNRIYYQIVLTKIDKLSTSDLQNANNIFLDQIDTIKKEFFINKIVLVSNRTKHGLKELIYEITQCI